MSNPAQEIGTLTTEDYISSVIRASGHWEARFHFCGWYGFNPKEVSIISLFSWGEYLCVMNKYPLKPFLMGLGSVA